jgi:hypothetical protein
MSFDIVIPLGPNEISRIHKQIEFTKKNVIGFRQIYIISCNMNISIDNCIMIDENIFPFKDFIRNYFAQYNDKNNRNGWYFQQLIKLYASHYIPEILDNYLVIDADVFFLKPIHFFENDISIYTTGNEYHIPYFEHMIRLHSSFSKFYNESGICHHMLFNKKYIQEIFDIVENQHSIPFWQAFILSVKEHKNYNISKIESGASEYELYFNYIIKNHSDKISIRNLNWANVPRYADPNNYLHLNYIAICEWIG